ncbi:glycerol-3-phosphate transporter [Bacillus sp. T17B1]|uniref:glycerol-3-phosphate transporter n=1 Tax=Bacillus sp. T17B1 TaxID=2918911 RepID=UPI00228176ED|nr:glycerol-3-phosphate transporter [Bacillus sp. T17B1]
MLNIFRPARHIERLDDSKMDAAYKRLRLQVFIGIFIGYAGYYLLRKNFAFAIPYLQEQGFSKTELGLVLAAVSIAYGFSKFIMGMVSDRCNPRYFLATGLFLSAIVNILFVSMPWVTSSVTIMFIFMFINGWFQGMGWPPCGRTMAHWFSISERGTKMSIWNVAHNIGGGILAPLVTLGIAMFVTWKSVFFFPAIIAIIISFLIVLLVRDTPQSCGLPPIEDYRNDYPKHAFKNQEKELTTKEILFQYVLNNKFLWYIAFANVFVYFVRYGVVDWAPTYLTEAKGFSPEDSRWSYFLYEYAGIPGTILCGWISDRFFKSRRAPAGVLFMAGVFVAVLVYWLNPAGHPLVDNIALISIGFLIYGPVMLIGLQAIDLAPKKAAGTAAGLTGFFGYIGGSAFANAIMGFVVDRFDWNGGFIMLITSCILAIVFLALTWNTGKRAEHV